MDLNTNHARIHVPLPHSDNPAEAEARKTEYRLPAATPNHTPLIIRQDPTHDGTRWAIIHVPGSRPMRHVWTKDGWDAAWCLSREEIYCWPNSAEALKQAQRAMTDADYEADVDNADPIHKSHVPITA